MRDRFEEDDPTGEAATLDDANLPTLLMFLVQATADRRWLGERYRPARTQGLTDNDDGGLPMEVQSEIRLAAAKAIQAWRDGKPLAIQKPTAELVVEMLSVCMGEEVSEEYGPLLEYELHRFTRARLVDEPEPMSPPPGFRVVVVGAGVSGLIAAAYLQEAGVEFTLVEKNPTAGGTWWQNRYPGAGVDTPSHLYSLSFAKFDWAFHFELREELQRYLEAVADDLDLKAHARFDTEVLSAIFDESALRWRVTVRNADGKQEVLDADAIVSAVGVLNRPQIPALPGRDRFKGPSFHTAAWPESLDVTNLRVGIIGSGASAMQVGPAIADEVQQLVIFQRSPQWIVPFEKFRKPVHPEVRRLLKDVPAYHGWYWLRLFWQFGDRVLAALRKDPEWEHPERSVNYRNDRHRELFTEYIHSEVGDRTDLLEHVVPTYPPFGKRILMDNGWYRMLRKPQVTLVPCAVESVTETGVVAGGEPFELDVLVYATGFEARRFVASMDIVGRDGQTLREAWDDDDGRAYLGICVPKFPNFFMLGGPNSFPGSGSFMHFMEMQMSYICKLLTELFRHDIVAVEPTERAFSEYNVQVDRLHDSTVWTHPGMETFFRNDRGRVVFISPFRNVEYWNMTRSIELDDYLRHHHHATKSAQSAPDSSDST